METQKTIAEWADATYALKDNASIAIEAHANVTELMRWLKSDDNHRLAAGQAADVAIILYWLVENNRGDMRRVVHEYGGAVMPAYSNLQRATILTCSLATLVRYLAVDAKNVPWTILADAMVCLDDLVMRLGSKLADEINKRMVTHRAGVVDWAAA